MKSAHPITNEAGAPGTGARIVQPGTLPQRKDTVAADLLSRLLSGNAMTGMDGVFGASTTRLAAHIKYLADRYGWTFNHRDKAVGCNDGRVAWIREYFLDPPVITAAQQQGAVMFCDEVCLSRAQLRTATKLARRQAEKVNAAAAARRLKSWKSDPRQFELRYGD